MSVGPLQVQVSGSPIGMSDVNTSVGMLQDAINNVSDRKDRKQALALQAIEQQKLLSEKNLKNAILQDPDSAAMNQDVLRAQNDNLSNRFNAEYNSLFDKNKTNDNTTLS